MTLSDQNVMFRRNKMILLVIQLKYLLRRLLVNCLDNAHLNFLLLVSAMGLVQSSRNQPWSSCCCETLPAWDELELGSLPLQRGAGAEQSQQLEELWVELLFGDQTLIRALFFLLSVSTD